MKKILYIEDDPIQRSVLTQMLELHGFDVEVAEDGISGIEKASSVIPDLIITDSKMPRLDGVKAIERIRANLPLTEIPIFALSARADSKYQTQALQAGATEVFTKPIDFNQLITTIQRSLANVA